MRVVLINSNRYLNPWPVIPFGLCGVAASLERAGHNVQFLDLCFSKSPSRDIHATIENFRPDIIGIGIRNIDNGTGYKTSFFLDKVEKEVISPCKAAFSGPIVIGGTAVGISGPEILQFFNLEFAIQGDGEEAMVAFVERIEKNLSLSGLAGLIRRSGNKIIEDNPAHIVQDLNSLPSADFSRYVAVKHYRQYNSPLQIQTKRGCSLNCVYCTYNRIEGPIYRLRNPELVANEIQSLVAQTGINHIEFTDSVFNIPLAHAKAVLRAVAAKQINIRCRTLGLNPAAVDEELVELMKRVGFQDVDLGVESGCDKTLRMLGKNYRKEDVLEAGRLLRAKKIPTSWVLLLGAPSETIETLQETFETIARAASPWDLIVISVGIRVYKGAPIAERLRNENSACTNDDFLHPVSYNPENLSLESIKLLSQQAYFSYPNLLSLDEDSQYPLFLLKVTTAIMDRLAPNQPVWRMYILISKLLTITGLNLIRKWIFNFKHRDALSQLKMD